MPDVYWDRNWPAPKMGDVFTTSPAKGTINERAIIGINRDSNGWSALVLDHSGRPVRITAGHLKLTDGGTNDAWRPLGTVWDAKFKCWVPPGYEIVVSPEFKYGRLVPLQKTESVQASEPTKAVEPVKTVEPPKPVSTVSITPAPPAPPPPRASRAPAAAAV